MKQCDRKRALCGNNSKADRLCDRARDGKTHRESEREDFVQMTTTLADWQTREEEKRFILWLGFLLAWRCSAAQCDPNIRASTNRRKNDTSSLLFTWTEASSHLFTVLWANDVDCYYQVKVVVFSNQLDIRELNNFAGHTWIGLSLGAKGRMWVNSQPNTTSVSPCFTWIGS